MPRKLERALYRTDVANGLGGWWTFDEGDFCEDSSGNGNHISLLGTAAGKSAGFIRAASGRAGGAYSCVGGVYGADGVKITAPASLLMSLQPWSVSAWIKTAGINNRGCIYSFTDSGASLYMAITLWTHKIGVWPSNGGPSLLSTTSVDDNLWHHIAVTTGADTRIYNNGVLDCTPGASQVQTWLQRDVWIGALGQYSGSNAYAYDGLIDDVRFYRRTLSAAEVHALYSEAFLSPNPYDGVISSLVTPSFIAAWAQQTNLPVLGTGTY